MQIGDSYTWTPAAFEGEASGARAKKARRARAVTGRIVYIHPQRRFFTAEAKVDGGLIRECFPITPK